MDYKNQAKEIPSDTKAAAKGAFKKGNKYVTLRDKLGIIFANEKFHHLFSHKGRRAEAPGNMALILVMQYMEGLSDREAAEQVGARIDWKYLLGLRLDEEGIRSQSLSDFRKRILAGGEEERLLNEIIGVAQELNLLKETKVQRTDATKILSAGRYLSRLELVWEGLSRVVEELAWRAPEWLQQRITARWVSEYARPIGWRQWTKKKEGIRKKGQAIGEDGQYLWQEIQNSPYKQEWSSLLEVKIWQEIWEQQYEISEVGIRWREESELPSANQRIESPYDIDARCSRRDAGGGWVGYQVHFTETVSPRSNLQLITDVTTTPACQPDNKTLPQIEAKLNDKGLLPEKHLADMGYISADNILQAKEKYDIDLLGPIKNNTSWQNRIAGAYDLSQFHIDWQQQETTCPQGKTTRSWSHTRAHQTRSFIRVRFAESLCRDCVAKPLCTTGKSRNLSFREQPQQEQIMTTRIRQKTAEFKSAYKKRAGVEATISQAMNHLDGRRSRYMGLAKTHFHNLLTAAAINLNRIASSLLGHTRARNRRSPLLYLQIAPDINFT